MSKTLTGNFRPIFSACSAVIAWRVMCSDSQGRGRQAGAAHAAGRGLPVAEASTRTAQRIKTQTQIGLLHPNRKRLIALLQFMLKFAPPEAGMFGQRHRHVGN
jgi:hypothetical protein